MADEVGNPSGVKLANGSADRPSGERQPPLRTAIIQHMPASNVDADLLHLQHRLHCPLRRWVWASATHYFGARRLTMTVLSHTTYVVPSTSRSSMWKTRSVRPLASTSARMAINS